MNKQTTRSNRGVLLRFINATFMAGLLAVLVLMFSLQTSQAGSATWNLDPTNGADWSTTTNWTPNTVPNDPTDVATFDLSNRPTPTLSEAVELSEMVFAPGASPFTIIFQRGRTLNLYGAGITNNSGIAQHFALDQFRGVSAQTVFHNSATAGDGTVFNVESPYPIPGLFFIDSSSAGTSTIVNNSTLDDVHGGDVTFSDSSTAAEATIINNGGLFSGGQGANTLFLGSGNGSSTAANATITARGGTVSGALGGSISFGTGAHAGNATLIADGGVAGAEGGFIDFFGVATGDRARIELFDTGYLLLTPLDTGVTIGSLEGDGVVFLGSKSLTIGSNDLSTTFSGVIQDSGSVTKIGRGRLVLTGDNHYGGKTIIKKGHLVINNSQGSGTGNGPAVVENGTLGGRGTIGGSVTVGNGNNGSAALAPGKNADAPQTLTIRGSLGFNGNGRYNCDLNSDDKAADAVVAHGVTLGGASFSLRDLGHSTLTPGLVFIIINNTATTPINGSFINMPDGGGISSGFNTFEANYEGGDGNDLTLTVVSN